MHQGPGAGPLLDADDLLGQVAEFRRRQPRVGRPFSEGQVQILTAALEPGVSRRSVKDKFHPSWTHSVGRLAEAQFEVLQARALGEGSAGGLALDRRAGGADLLGRQQPLVSKLADKAPVQQQRPVGVADHADVHGFGGRPGGDGDLPAAVERPGAARGARLRRPTRQCRFRRSGALSLWQWNREILSTVFDPAILFREMQDEGQPFPRCREVEANRYLALALAIHPEGCPDGVTIGGRGAWRPGRLGRSLPAATRTAQPPVKDAVAAGLHADHESQPVALLTPCQQDAIPERYNLFLQDIRHLG